MVLILKSVNLKGDLSFIIVLLSKKEKIIVTMLMFISLCVIFVSAFNSIFTEWANDYITKGNLLLIILLKITLLVLRKRLYDSLNQNPVVRFLLSFIPAIFISVAGLICVRIYLITFDRLFIYLGSLKRLNKMQKNEG